MDFKIWPIFRLTAEITGCRRISVSGPIRWPEVEHDATFSVVVEFCPVIGLTGWLLKNMAKIGTLDP